MAVDLIPDILLPVELVLLTTFLGLFESLASISLSFRIAMSVIARSFARICVCIVALSF